MQQESEALQVVAKVRERKDHVAAPPRPQPLGRRRHGGCCSVSGGGCIPAAAAAGMNDGEASAGVGAAPGVPHEAGRHS